MTIGLDMMGGDYAPLEAVKGVKSYLTGNDNALNLVLIGNEPVIRQLLAENDVTADCLTIVHADETIDMHEHPTKALREKQKSSIAIGFHLLLCDYRTRDCEASLQTHQLASAVSTTRPKPAPTLRSILANLGKRTYL